MNELKEILLLKEKMKILQDEIIYIETLLTKINKELNPISVKSSKKNNTQDLIIKLIETKDEYMNISLNYAKIKRIFILKLMKINNKNQIALLYKRYVLGMNLSETAKSMKITYKWAQELHKRGVNSYKNVII